MDALAKGGIQVGELAKLYYPGGTDIKILDKEKALKQTNDALQSEEAIIYEAALQSGNKFIRVDVLVKTKHHIKLIEVKSKSCDGNDPGQLFNTKGIVSSEWLPYVEDIAFQYCVAQQALKDQDRIILPYLMCADKTKKCDKEGLYERFLLKKNDRGRTECVVKPGTDKSVLGNQILTEIRVTEAVNYIINGSIYQKKEGWAANNFLGIIEWFEALLASYDKGAKGFLGPVGRHCKECQFITPGQKDLDGKKSGFKNCFQKKLKWSEHDFEKELAWKVWRANTKKILEQGKWFMEQLDVEDILKKDEVYQEPIRGCELTTSQRKWVQVKHLKSSKPKPYLDVEGLSNNMSDFRPPFHFIDFETIAPAIPFYKGYAPYEGLCFQFSHHKMNADGSYMHHSEYLGMGQGTDPCFDFIANLYESLHCDDGTIFMYATHENTYLNYMIRLLMHDSPFDEAQSGKYINFLQSISKPTKSNAVKWQEGPRVMVDMAKIVRSYYWHPLMGGSNSIKQVLPAVLNHSQTLQEKYAHPIYGATGGIPSLNFKNKVWVEWDENGLVKDPYHLLHSLDMLFPDGVEKTERLYLDEEVGNGGAAMMAWAYMQFAEMSCHERESIAKALKQYCELDTLAMVMIYEFWKHEVEKHQKHLK